jgi:23S rRNA (cytosine1962-C5)-methyltransferase
MSPPAPRVTLKPGHVLPVHSGHPWVFQQAIGGIEGGAVAGDEIDVVDPRGNFLGRGLYSPRSAIPVRIFSRTPGQRVDGELLRERIRRAVALRRSLDLPGGPAGRETDAFRAVNGEGDGLPGLVVDLFRDVACVQLNTIGLRRREGAVHDAIGAALAPRAIVDRTSEGIARTEGFEVTPGVVRGAPIEALTFRERGIDFTIPLALGQKTGFYLDQRPIRARIEQLAQGRRVLDTYCFVGAIALGAARGGAASVMAVDESATALEAGAEIARRHPFGDRVTFTRADARKALDQASADGGFDLVICDPPKLAQTQRGRDGALGAYQRLAASACRATRPGGLLVFCSCSGAVSIDDLIRALAKGARQANLAATVLERWFQGADHPVPAAFPEGLYLKAVIAQVHPLAS